MDPNERLKPIPHEFRHCVPLQTRFGDFDTFGHINNNVYMAFFDLGKVSYFSSFTGGVFSPKTVAAVVVNINVDFLAPTQMGEPIEVVTMVTHIGERSITVYQRIQNSETGEVKTQATTILAGFDVATQSSAPLDETLVKAIVKFDNPELLHKQY